MSSTENAPRPRIARRAAITLSVALCLGSAIAAPQGGSAKTPSAPLGPLAPVAFPPVRFMHMSDLHLYQKSLGTAGPAFEAYMANDRKLLPESEDILDRAIAEILALPPDERPAFIAISGDLTKDGEETNHLLAAKKLAALEAAGIQVWVAPGNHDINNPDAYRFTLTGKEALPTVDPARFAEIYADFGYSQAFSRDPSSLSYAVEPVPGLVLISSDACDYMKNAADKTPHIGGAYTKERLSWIDARLAEANAAGKAVIMIQHHGLVEHWYGQRRYHPDYLVTDFAKMRKRFADLGLRYVFSGHYHAVDVAVSLTGLTDVESGSLVSWPVSYRQVDLSPEGIEVRTRTVDAIPGYESGFQDFAFKAMKDSIYGLAIKTLAKYGTSKHDSDSIARQVSDAFAAHYRGDEGTDGPAQDIDKRGFTLMGNIVISQLGYVIEGLWKDSPGSDRTFTAKTGNASDGATATPAP